MSKYLLFKIIAFLEGLSFIILLGIAMPLKYIWGEPWMVRQVGMAHGLLFMAYVYMAFWVRKDVLWTNCQLVLVLFLSVLPFGTFFVTRIRKG